jgi:hypothetical protein
MFQPFDKALSRVFRLQPVKKVGPGVTIRLLALDHVIGHDEHRMGDSHKGALLPTSWSQPPVLRTERGPFGPRGGMGRWHQHSAQEAMSVTVLSRVKPHALIAQ